MKLIKASFEILTPIEWLAQQVKIIELAGRTCYKSEGKITCDSAGPFVKKIAQVHKHESVIEHSSVTVRFIIDRGVSHELVRHRLAAYSQESTRYICYAENGKTGHCQFIIPSWFQNFIPGIVEACGSDTYYIQPESHLPDSVYVNDAIKAGYIRGMNLTNEEAIWINSMIQVEQDYNLLRAGGWRPEQARAILPNSTKTEVVMTCNLREWRHVLKMRTSNHAHPQIREVMVPLLAEFKKHLPELFDDIV